MIYPGISSKSRAPRPTGLAGIPLFLLLLIPRPSDSSSILHPLEFIQLPHHQKSTTTQERTPHPAWPLACDDQNRRSRLVCACNRFGNPLFRRLFLTLRIVNIMHNPFSRRSPGDASFADLSLVWKYYAFKHNDSVYNFAP
ncbi:MAG TPA: hypothetical protein PKM57_14490 [Kiritimatiellia bacterium]|nr:hypothetical protein [Kiritimatiellia bacterium]HPS06936.1 hypothetical protein [Kiritimatiellia bacterium]